MRRFFISTHGLMASGIKSSLEILLGKADNVTIFDAYLDERSVASEVEKFLKAINPCDQAILLSDLYGGSVNQVLYQYLNCPNVLLVTGINLALVLELVAASEQNITSIELDQLIECSRSVMKQCRLDCCEVIEDDFF